MDEFPIVLDLTPPDFDRRVRPGHLYLRQDEFEARLFQCDIDGPVDVLDGRICKQIRTTRTNSQQLGGSRLGEGLSTDSGSAQRLLHLINGGCQVAQRDLRLHPHHAPPQASKMAVSARIGQNATTVIAAIHFND